MQFNLYIGNHGKRDGIEDFIEIISDILSKRGHEVVVSNELKASCPNIIIDEFTNFITNRKLAYFKKAFPETKLVYVLTEFIEKKYGLTSFNLFDGLEKVSVLTLVNIYLKLRRSDFPSPTLYDFILAFLHLPFYSVYFLSHLLKNNFFKKKSPTFSFFFHKQIYMLMRFLGMKSMLCHADLILLAHRDITKNLSKYLINPESIAGVIYPELDISKIKQNLFEKKILSMELTGSVTPYRQGWVETINKSIILLGIRHEFGMSQVYSFMNSTKKTLRGAFSFHPPQTYNWKYSSPTRLFRALNQEGNIPVLTHYFNQHPIEDVCLLYEGDQTILKMYEFFHNKNKAWAYLLPKLESYAQQAELENNNIVQKMILLDTSGSQ